MNKQYGYYDKHEVRAAIEIIRPTFGPQLAIRQRDGERDSGESLLRFVFGYGRIGAMAQYHFNSLVSLVGYKDALAMHNALLKQCAAARGEAEVEQET